MATSQAIYQAVNGVPFLLLSLHKYIRLKPSEVEGEYGKSFSRVIHCLVIHNAHP